MLGNLNLPNRLVMAPLTRGRADLDGTPNDLMATYYEQRSSAAFLITEATAVSKMGYGWIKAPGVFTDSHEEGWKKITAAVHRAGGRIFLQLWHMGRVSHPDFLGGELPVSSSAVRAAGESRTPEGKKPFVIPRELTKGDILQTIGDYALAAKRAKRAGFDGVEIHGANGYLIDQFIRDCSNKRSDEYGGTIQNRLRFLREVTQAVLSVWDRFSVGVRLSPVNPFNDMFDSSPQETFVAAAKILQELQVGYMHVIEAPKGHMMWADYPPVSPHMRAAFKGTFIANGGYDADRAQTAIETGQADLVAFGVPFLANPDLPKRMKAGGPYNTPDFTTFYTHEEKGYTDYQKL